MRCYVKLPAGSRGLRGKSLVSASLIGERSIRSHGDEDWSYQESKHLDEQARVALWSRFVALWRLLDLPAVHGINWPPCDRREDCFECWRTEHRLEGIHGTYRAHSSIPTQPY